MEVKCYKCHTQLSIIGNVPRNEECTICHANIHSCRMCKFYDTNSYNECKETSADRVTDKEKANFCDYFAIGNNKLEEDNKKSLLNAAEKLFKSKK